MSKPKFSRYNDGILAVFREKPKKTDFNAKKNVSMLDDLEFVAKLAYEECSRREQDLEFANQNDFTLSLKLKTRFHSGVDNKCKVLICGYLYDVSYLDSSKTEMWFYLTGVRKIDS